MSQSTTPTMHPSPRNSTSEERTNENATDDTMERGLVNTNGHPEKMEKGKVDEKVEKRDANGDEEKKGDYEIVKWDEGEAANPQNFAKWKKWIYVLIVAHGSTCATTCSSMVASTYTAVEQEFGISNEVATLGLTLFISGLGIGPLFLGPLSEFFGRAPVYRYSYLLFVLFNIPVALGKNAETWLIGRFLSGMSGSAFLSVAGGSVADMFRGYELSMPMAIYTASPFIGPVIGPIIAGFINQHTSWRWTWYVQIIWAFVELVLLVFVVPETYSPVLLKKKAIRLRQETGNERLRAPLELDERTISQAVLLSTTVPFKLVASEPMALALNTWTAILLGIMYMFFSAFPIVFAKHGFDLQEKGLTFIGIGLGIIIATALNPIFDQRTKHMAEQQGRRLVPEDHLVKGLYGAIICPVALFWFAFTTYTSVHWVVPIVASIPFGFGMVLAFSATFTFLVDAYRPYAASAMASNSFMRSAMAAAFPLFTTQMYNKLGTAWASALCAFLLTGLAPFPFLFYKYGHRLRKSSKYCVSEGH